MVLKDHAFAILNGTVNANDHDMLEALQFVVDNGYVNELTPKQLLILRDLVESDKVFTPTLFLNLP